jgi:hypothetical protein
LEGIVKKVVESWSDESPCNETLVKSMCETFIRKYTHARIGGLIRGEYDQHVEEMGGRSKGGAGLRDKLYTMEGGEDEVVDVVKDDVALVVEGMVLK